MLARWRWKRDRRQRAVGLAVLATLAIACSGFGPTADPPPQTYDELVERLEALDLGTPEAAEQTFRDALDEQDWITAYLTMSVEQQVRISSEIAAAVHRPEDLYSPTHIGGLRIFEALMSDVFGSGDNRAIGLDPASIEITTMSDGDRWRVELPAIHPPEADGTRGEPKLEDRRPLDLDTAYLQSIDLSSAEAVAQEFLDANAQGRWLDATELIAPARFVDNMLQFRSFPTLGFEIRTVGEDEHVAMKSDVWLARELDIASREGRLLVDLTSPSEIIRIEAVGRESWQPLPDGPFAMDPTSIALVTVQVDSEPWPVTLELLEYGELGWRVGRMIGEGGDPEDPGIVVPGRDADGFRLCRAADWERELLIRVYPTEPCERRAEPSPTAATALALQHLMESSEGEEQLLWEGALSQSEFAAPTLGRLCVRLQYGDDASIPHDIQLEIDDILEQVGDQIEADFCPAGRPNR